MAVRNVWAEVHAEERPQLVGPDALAPASAVVQRARGALETPSGKGAHNENFPVGSFLLRRDLRPDVATFYAFARAIDDIADNQELTPEEKDSRLDQFANALVEGTGDPQAFQKAHAIRLSLAQRGISSQHCLDLVDAFKQDAFKRRYRDWDELMDYCRRSAAPVGRYLLDLHGESPEGYPASDALCSALQVLNHLQDAQDDFETLDRVYLPSEWLEQGSEGHKALAFATSTPVVRATIDQALEGVEALLEAARPLVHQLRSRRLAMESSVIWELAHTLSRRLARMDPLAQRVRLTRWDFVLCGVLGVVRALLAGPNDRLATETGPDHVQAVVERSGTSFRLGMRILERPRRAAMYAIYAFCREVDDVADAPGGVEAKRQALAGWRTEVDQIYRGRPETPTGRALLGPVKAYMLPQEEFLKVIEGMETDVEGRVHAPSLDELELYCRRAAGAVGMLSIHAFGAAGPDEQKFALALGEALQLTNILRDLDEDAVRGRLYLPREWLEAEGIDVGQRPAVILQAPGFEKVCWALSERAMDRFQEAETLLAACDAKKLRPALCMMGSYMLTLEKLRESEFRRDARSVRLSRWTKLWASLRSGWFGTRVHRNLS
jgi:hydroxysqualene synthase